MSKATFAEVCEDIMGRLSADWDPYQPLGIPTQLLDELANEATALGLVIPVSIEAQANGKATCHLVGRFSASDFVLWDDGPGWVRVDSISRWEDVISAVRKTLLEWAAYVRSERFVVEPPADNEGETLKRLLAMMDDNAPRIIAIADSDSLDASEKMAAICEIDARFYGKTPADWAIMLKVSDRAIRKTKFWKFDRPRLMGDAEERFRELNPDGKLPEWMESPKP